jgi:hypothetical protein
MMENENIKKTLQELKKYYAAEREKLNDINKLVQEPVDREIVTDFWKLSNAEIEREMYNCLSILDSDADCLPNGLISSQRLLLGKPIVFFKKLIRRLTNPYSSMLLQKQNRLNRELVTFQLLNFLKFRHLDKRVREIEEKMADRPDTRQAGPQTNKKRFGSNET